jgi:hypothetical protein
MNVQDKRAPTTAVVRTESTSSLAIVMQGTVAPPAKPTSMNVRERHAHPTESVWMASTSTLAPVPKDTLASIARFQQNALSEKHTRKLQRSETLSCLAATTVEQPTSKHAKASATMTPNARQG